MQTIRQLLRGAIKTENFKVLGHVVDTLREKGYTYKMCFEAAQRAVPELTEAEWEGMMLAADSGGE